MTFDELVARVERLEQREIAVADLPLAALQRRLESGWLPDGGILLQEKSVTSASLGTGTLVSGEQRLRLVRGEVSAAGAVVNGGGFTSVQTGVGAYTVTITSPFLAVPVLALSTAAGGINITANAVGAFSVLNFNTATGAALNSGWHFLAIGLD